MTDNEFERLCQYGVPGELEELAGYLNKPSGDALLEHVAGLVTEASRLRTMLKDAPHGALCKRGFKSLYDPGGKCTCWKRFL
jgi:hypothetical protein